MYKVSVKEEMELKTSAEHFQPVLEKRRWLMLAIFSTVIALSCFQWLHINIISPSAIFFWNGSLPEDKAGKEIGIVWLSMIYMVAYIPMIFPATWIFNRFGLRVTLLIGAGLNALGGCIKCVAMEISQPYGVTTTSAKAAFPVLMVGQFISSIAQDFILGMPAQVAASWFGEKELTMATSIGVFGNQFGCAIGFLIPPLLVPSVNDNTTVAEFDNVRNGFRYLLYGGAIVLLVDFLIVILFFRDHPKIAPSRAQYRRIQRRHDRSLNDSETDRSDLPPETQEILKMGYSRQMLYCFKNINFIFLLLSYGCNTGVYYEISSLLNPIIAEYFPNEHVTIGWIGFSLTISGLIGSLIAGLIFKKTGLYKQVYISFFIMSIVSYGAFMGSLYSPHIAAVFFTIILLGFFQTGFLPLGFEYGAEIMYPIDEGLTSGILSTASELFGVIFTYIATALLTRYGALVANAFSLICLFVFAIPTCFITNKLKRRQAQKKIITDDDDEDKDRTQSPMTDRTSL